MSAIICDRCRKIVNLHDGVSVGNHGIHHIRCLDEMKENHD